MHFLKVLLAYKTNKLHSQHNLLSPDLLYRCTHHPFEQPFPPHNETYRWLHIGKFSFSFLIFFLYYHRFCFFFLFCLFYSLKFFHIGIVDKPLRDRQRQNLSGPDHIPETSHLRYHKNMTVITIVPLLLELEHLFSCTKREQLRSRIFKAWWGMFYFKNTLLHS